MVDDHTHNGEQFTTIGGNAGKNGTDAILNENKSISFNYRNSIRKELNYAAIITAPWW